VSGFNLPPGVNVKDIPGNRPEDSQLEWAYERLSTVLTEIALELGQENVLELVNWWWDDLPRPVRDRLSGIPNPDAKNYCDFCGRDGSRFSGPDQHADGCPVGEREKYGDAGERRRQKSK